MSGVADIVELKEERSKRTPLTDSEFETAGDMLRAAREARDLSIEDVGEATNVRTDYLQAIEIMAIDRLPIPAYTSGFVKAYAQYLELPVEPLVQRFRKEAGYGLTAHIAPEVAIPTSTELRGGRELSLLAVVAIVAFIVWVAIQITRPPRDIGPVELTGTPLQERPIEEPEIAFTAENEVPVVAGASIAKAEPGSKAPESETDTVAAEAEVEEGASDQPVPDFVPKLKTPVPPVEEADVTADELNQIEAAASISITSEEVGPVADPETTALNNELLRELEASLQAPVELAVEPASGELNTLEDVLNLDSLSNPSGQPSSPAVTPSVTAPLEPAIVEAAITQAVASRKIPPVYPTRCERRAKDSEEIVVTFDITSRGAVVNPRITSSTNQCFDRSALSAIIRWRFAPTKRDGVPVPTYGRSTRFNFQLPE